MFVYAAAPVDALATPARSVAKPIVKSARRCLALHPCTHSQVSRTHSHTTHPTHSTFLRPHPTLPHFPSHPTPNLQCPELLQNLFPSWNITPLPCSFILSIPQMPRGPKSRNIELFIMLNSDSIRNLMSSIAIVSTCPVVMLLSKWSPLQKLLLLKLLTEVKAAILNQIDNQNKRGLISANH